MIPMEHTTGHRGRPLQAPRPTLLRREHYLVALTWAFTFFNSVRVLSYLPTIWLIVEQQDASQHSLLTWSTWFGANLTMAAWLHEHNGRRVNRAVVVNLVNAAMCAATVALIAVYRIAA